MIHFVLFLPTQKIFKRPTTPTLDNPRGFHVIYVHDSCPYRNPFKAIAVAIY